jgi:hypothetical protein
MCHLAWGLAHAILGRNRLPPDHGFDERLDGPITPGRLQIYRHIGIELPKLVRRSESRINDDGNPALDEENGDRRQFAVWEVGVQNRA